MRTDRQNAWCRYRHVTGEGCVMHSKGIALCSTTLTINPIHDQPSCGAPTAGASRLLHENWHLRADLVDEYLSPAQTAEDEKHRENDRVFHD
jgi:hypothetical protein